MFGASFPLVLKNGDDARVAMQSQSQSPHFRLDLNPALIRENTQPPHFRFPGHRPSKPYNTRPASDESFRAIDELYVMSIPRRLLTTLFLVQCMTVFVLCMLVAGLLYWSHRLNSNVNWYYNAAYPYIQEVSDRGISMVRHADNSSAALETVMAGAQVLTTQSIPSLMDSVNRTSAMVGRLEHMARNPTIKLSMA